MTIYLIISLILNLILCIIAYWYRTKWEMCTMIYQTAIHEDYSEIRNDGTYKLMFVKQEKEKRNERINL